MNNYLNRDRNFPVGITINCRNCGNSKGCEIKKDFRNFVKDKSYAHYWETKFELRCPLKTRVFDTGDKVVFTVGAGTYFKKHLWQCNFDYTDCDICKHNYNCDNGTVEFMNKRYAKYVQLEGEISSFYWNELWFVRVKTEDFEKIKSDFNDIDLKRIKEINEKYNVSGEYDEFSDFLAGFKKVNRDYIIFISKRKFIKKIV